MAFQDSDAERRNLMITSLAIIIFFLAEGEFNEVVRLPMVNIKFLDTTMLVIFVWLILFWFAYRYWLKHATNFIKGIHREIQMCSNDENIYLFVCKKLNAIRVPDNQVGCHVQKVRLDKFKIVVNYFFGTVQHRTYDTYIASEISPGGDRGAESGEIALTGWRGSIEWIRVFLKCFFTKPTFSDFIVPYLLFLFVCGLGVRAF